MGILISSNLGGYGMNEVKECPTCYHEMARKHDTWFQIAGYGDDTNLCDFWVCPECGEWELIG